MTDAYAAAVRAPRDWIDGQPGLRDALARWNAEPRGGEQLVGALHRPGLGLARGIVRRSMTIPPVTARWLTRHGNDVESDPARIGSGGLWKGAADFLLLATALAGPGGRSFVSTLQGLRPELVGDMSADTLTPPQTMPRSAVERRLGGPTRERLTELDDHPVSVSEFDQVHRGRLDDMTPVAVVVSRPGVARDIRDDACVLAPWLVGAEILDPSPWRHGLVEILRDVVVADVRRCDQRAVALDAVVLQTALADAGVDDVRVARPVPSLVDRDSAVYELPTGERLRQHPSRSSLLATGISTIAETGLVLGVYLKHLDPGYAWADRHSVTSLVGGTSIGVVHSATRRALADLLMSLGSRQSPVDALVAVGVLPPFVDRDEVTRLLVDVGVADPLALLGRDGRTRMIETARTLVTDHRARPTPEAVEITLAVMRLVAALRRCDEPTDPTELFRALSRLAGIGSRITAAA